MVLALMISPLIGMDQLAIDKDLMTEFNATNTFMTNMAFAIKDNQTDGSSETTTTDE